MKVIELYILRRTVSIFAATLFWVLAIVWTTQILSRIDVVTGGQSAATFFEIAWLVLPAVIPIIAPFAVGIAVAQTLSTMNTDSELIVISAAGSPRMTVIRPILLLAVATCIVSFVINNFVESYSRERLRVLISESRADLISTVIQEGNFQELENGLYMQIGERLPDGRFGGIFVSDTREENVELIYYAKSGVMIEHGDEHVLAMQDGVVHRKTGADVSIIQYSSYALDLSQFMAAGGNPTLLPKDRSLAYLLNPDPNDKIYKAKPQSFREEIHERFTEWLYPMAFALIALAVAGDSRSFREARVHPLLTTMAIALIVRWAGFIANSAVGDSAAFVPVAYLVPLLACAVSIFFIATNRVMELPLSVVERLTALWSAAQQRVVAFKIWLSGYKRPATRGPA